MERPASVVAAASPSKHRRNASTKSAISTTTTRPSTSQVLTLFTTNLRLLDLDLLAQKHTPPIPPLLPSAFSTSSSPGPRIRATEFALYHLFRLLNPSLTADKLTPFFPPLEPLQSLNLRAALHRCLEGLKKDGVLGAGVAVRKSMLDDCAGERLWEVCLGLSAVVLKKVVLERRDKVLETPAGKLGVARTLSREERARLEVLVLAQRVGLAKVLKEQGERRERYGELQGVLTLKEQELEERRVKADMLRKETKMTSAQRARLADVEETVERQWRGSDELRGSIVNGGDQSRHDEVLTASLDDLFKTRHTQTSAAGISDPYNVLDNAKQQQRIRMRRWQSLHSTLHASKPDPPANTPPIDQPSALRFDKHRTLSVRDIALCEPRQSPHKASTSFSHYDDILTSMREQLRQRAIRPTTSPFPRAPKRTQTAPSPSAFMTRKPSVHLDTHAMAGALDPHHQLSPSLVRPRHGAGTSPGRSRSYQQPKVEGQRGVIPLKAELFSPLKGEVQRSPMRTGRWSGSSLGRTPTEETKGTTPSESDPSPEEEKTDSGLGIEVATAASSPGEGALEPEQVHVRRTQSPASVAREVDGLAAEAIAPPPPARPSLAERTRMSMAFTPSREASTLLPEPALASPEAAAVSPSPVARQPTSTTTKTLQERTRQSISLSKPPANNIHHGHTRSRSSILYPINQFETPRKLSEIPERAERRNVTPREQLFSPEAEYDSVFKPRPKVGLSPVGSAGLGQ